MQELCYAVDDDGKFVTVQSTGWDVKTVVLNESLKLIEERVEHAKGQYLSGKVSPVPYYMELNKMDLPLLASYMRIHRWFIKRHFKPSVFKNLSQKTLEKYADVFEVPLEELQNPFKYSHED